MKKRVVNLYRVSTKSQVGTEDDIPMQRKACRKFIEEQKDWELVEEYSELGVSGWKKGTDDRDALIQIKLAAENGEFDILLVFMLDRLGRKEDESPLVVDFLHKNGVEVWSVKEGKRSMEHHIDKLMNYITFWQSSGESVKTSMRVKEIMNQMNEENMYTGGRVPIGFEIYDTDVRHPKKDKFIKNIRIHEKEGEVVKLIFSLFLDKGYGAGRIARHLNDMGYKNREGKVWRDNTILRMLRNPIYTGRKRYNYYKNKNEINEQSEWKLQDKDESLAIVSENDFYKVQQIMDIRKNKTSNPNINIPTKSKLLFTGMAICGYCGNKLGADYSVKKYKRKSDGETTVTTQYRYICHHAKSVNHPKRTYAAKKYDDYLVTKIKKLLGEEIDINELMSRSERHKKEIIAKSQKEIDQLKVSLESQKKKMDKLNDELVNVLMGESKFTEEQLSRALQKVEKDIEECEERIRVCEIEKKDAEVEFVEVKQVSDNNKNWVEKFDQADFDEKKVMLSQVIDKIIIKENDIKIKVNMTIEQSMREISDKYHNIEAYNQPLSDSFRGINTLRELMDKHDNNKDIGHLKFDVDLQMD